MNYLILITEEIKPVLVEVPHKPQFSALELLSPATDTDTPIKAYNEAIQSAISDKSKHIQLKRNDVLSSLLVGAPWPSDKFLDEWLKERSGQTFPLPTGYKVSLEYQMQDWNYVEGHPKYWRSITENEFYGDDSQQRKLAILSKLEEEKTGVPKSRNRPAPPVVAPSEEVKQETPPMLQFKFNPDAEFTFEEWEEISKKRRPEDTKDNKAWSGAWLEGEMVGYARCMIQRVLKTESFTSRELEIAFCIGMLNQKDLDIDKLSDQLNHAKFEMVKEYIKSLRKF